MHIPEIIEVKKILSDLKDEGFVTAWELPYENILTRLTAAIFFITPNEADTSSLSTINKRFEAYPNFSFRENSERKLSQLKYRITFSIEEKEKNAALVA